LRTLAEIRWRAADEQAASTYLERAADMQPFDTDLQRALIAMALARGRHSQGRRRYLALRARMLKEFGQDPDFELHELADTPENSVRELLRWRA
jgi:DNA-binding SARP family transcriptional activator